MVKQSKKKKSKDSKKTNKHLAKLGAIEMSMTTIVVIVISVIMLIFGIIFVRSVMCAGIQLTEQVNDGVKGELIKIFGADKYGVSCMGSAGKDAKVGTGGRRQIVCMIKTESQEEYNIKVDVESLTGAKDSAVQKWIIDEGWKGDVKPGDGKDAVILILDIPRDAPATTLKLKIQTITENGEDTDYSTIDVIPVGVFRTTMCSI